MIGYRDLRCSTENSTQYSVMVYVGKKSESEWMCWSSVVAQRKCLDSALLGLGMRPKKGKKEKKKKKEWMGVYA